MVKGRIRGNYNERIGLEAWPLPSSIVRWLETSSEQAVRVKRGFN